MIPVFSPYISISDYLSVFLAMRKTYISGTSPIVREFEDKLAKKFDRKYAVALSNAALFDHFFKPSPIEQLISDLDDEPIISFFGGEQSRSLRGRNNPNVVNIDLGRNLMNFGMPMSS